MLHLCGIFAVDLFGYAIMSNHYHAVLSVNPSRASKWTDEEVADRWLSIAGYRGGAPEKAQYEAKRSALLADTARLRDLRERLGSLSWMMRYLNEYIARRANAEDECKGRFWEGRFQSQRLLDEHAILGCMVYVDLNPVRAGLARDFLKATHTSLSRRTRRQGPRSMLKSLAAPYAALGVDISLADYIELVRWTAVGRKDAVPKRRRWRGLDVEQWFVWSLPKPGSWPRAMGSPSALRAYARELGQRWIRVPARS